MDDLRLNHNVKVSVFVLWNFYKYSLKADITLAYVMNIYVVETWIVCYRYFGSVAVCHRLWRISILHVIVFKMTGNSRSRFQIHRLLCVALSSVGGGFVQLKAQVPYSILALSISILSSDHSWAAGNIIDKCNVKLLVENINTYTFLTVLHTYIHKSIT